jgi:hypothetical protein
VTRQTHCGEVSEGGFEPPRPVRGTRPSRKRPRAPSSSPICIRAGECRLERVLSRSPSQSWAHDGRTRQRGAYSRPHDGRTRQRGAYSRPARSSIIACMSASLRSSSSLSEAAASSVRPASCSLVTVPCTPIHSMSNVLTAQTRTVPLRWKHPSSPRDRLVRWGGGAPSTGTRSPGPKRGRSHCGR